MQGAAFIRFSVSKEGNIIDEACNEGVPDSLAAFLLKVIKSTDGEWVPGKKNGLNHDSKAYLLPVMYFLEAKCKPVDNTFRNTYLMLSFGNKEKPTAPAFFWGQNFEPLECIILSPVFLRSSYH
jgi:hypothetical protein